MAQQAPMIAAGPIEVLRSERHADGIWHARYPTASTTLCGRAVHVQATMGRPCPPDCGKCGRAARLFDRIDGSMPTHWRVGTAA